MKFGVPRSPSTSPERRQFRGRSSYGLYSDSDSESNDEVESDSDSADSSALSNSCSQLSDLRTTRAKSRTDAEMRYVEDTIAAIRLRTRHQDPYEKWEQETRKDAFRIAKKSLTESQTRWHDERDQARTADLKRLSALHSQQISEVQNHLQMLRQQQQNEEKRLRDGWKARDQILWKRIESVINAEEDKLRRKLEEERRIMQEAEAKRRIEEEKKLLEEEKRKKEEEEARKQKVEKERKEAEDKHRKEEEERTRLGRQEAEKQYRHVLGLTTIDEDWNESRKTLHRLKTEVMKVVKANKEMRKVWSDLRRQITPKIGQLTNDEQSIVRITKQLIQICKPSEPHSPLIHTALLSSLAKAIILQAETEVTAEVRTAEPLSKVAVSLLSHLDGFPEILYTRIVQRIGGWAIPIVVPPKDFDGRSWENNGEWLKVMGYRKGATGEEMESTAEYCTRIAGIMRVYFHILRLRPGKPLPVMFQTPRYWVWFARMVGGQHRALLGSPAAAYLIHTALNVMGSQAKDVWGLQWIKMLALIYEGVTEGIAYGTSGEKILIGGGSPEGISARMRVQLEVERIMADVNPTTIGSGPLTTFS